MKLAAFLTGSHSQHVQLSIHFSILVSQQLLFMVALCNRGAIIFLPCNFFLSIGKQEGQHPLTGQRAPPISGGT